jgi:NitT/TauT family transport system substrate-binding protein
MALWHKLLAISAILTVAGLGNHGLAASAQTEQVLHLGAAPFEAAGGAYYAQEVGFFKRNGLNVDIQIINTGAATLAAVVGGSLQVGGGNPLPLAQARERGLNVVLIAPGYIYDAADPPGSMLVVNSQSSIGSGKDLIGKTVAITSLGSVDHVAASVWLDSHGGDTNSVKYVEIPPSAMGDAVASGRVDAALIGQPALGAALEGGRVRALARPYDAVGRHIMVTGWFSTGEWASSHPDQVRRFQVAINQAAAWAVQNPEAAAQVLGKYLKINMQRAHEYHARSLDPSLVQPLLDGAVRYKILSRPIKAEELFWKSGG